MEHELDLIGYMEGTLNQGEKEEIETHLKECIDCKQEYPHLLKMESLFQAILRHQPDFFVLIQTNS